MKLFFTILMFSFFVTQIISCSSTQKRTKWSDPVLRVALIPQGIGADAYMRIESALVASHKYWVVDRKSAFYAALNEQTLTRISNPDRFDDSEKFARLGKMFGVGGVIEAHMQCVNQSSWLSGQKVHCFQYLQLVSTSTGEVLSVSEAEGEAPEALWDSPEGGATPSWKEAVEKLNDNFPENFEKEHWTPEMKDFKKVIREEAIREQEGSLK